MKGEHTIWILEDQAESIFIYREVLGIRFGLEFIESISALEGRIGEVPTKLPNLLIADLKLPDGFFTTFLSSRAPHNLLNIPYLIVSSLDDLDVLRFCFEKGALDYLVKPFKRNELIVKVENILSGPRPSFLKDGVSSETKGLEKLTTKENQILQVFLSRENHEATREEIMSSVWSTTSVQQTVLDVHLYHLRRKLISTGIEVRHLGPGRWGLLKLSQGPQSPKLASASDFEKIVHI